MSGFVMNTQDSFDVQGSLDSSNGGGQTVYSCVQEAKSTDEERVEQNDSGCFSVGLERVPYLLQRFDPKLMPETGADYDSTVRRHRQQFSELPEFDAQNEEAFEEYFDELAKLHKGQMVSSTRNELSTRPKTSTRQ
eukprot:GHVH01013444.1.p1 GENE.GHVH01013444.1~~GHVH01013444.1.p1  ORF type:complete len:136 (+),score=17.28 GHVH01013444.1:295-702(+)